MPKLMRRGIQQKNSSEAAFVSASFFSLWSQKILTLLLVIFFGLSPLLVVSGYTPDGRLFCTLYDLPKINFIAAFVPLFGVFYGFYLYRNVSRMEACSAFLRQNLSVKLFLLLLVAMGASILGSLVVKAGLYNLSNYILLVILGFILAQIFLHNRLRWVAVYALLTALLIFTGLGILQFFSYKILFLKPILGPASTFGYRNPAAHFIALVIPFVLFAVWRHWRLWRACGSFMQFSLFGGLLVLALAALALLFMNYSRTAIMALLAETLVLPFVWFVSKKKAAGERGWKRQSLGRAFAYGLLLVVVIFALVMVFPQSRKRFEGSFNKFKQGGVPQVLEFRYYHWCNSLMMIKDHPILGVGLGNWRFNYPLYYKSLAKDPLFNYQMQVRKTHNDYLQLAAECGIPALCLFLLLWGRQFYLLRYATVESDDGEDWRLPLLASLLAFSVIMFFSFPMQMAYSRMFCFFLLALGEARAWPALSS